ncbi:MAG TPA: glycosyltransferase family 2 protein, partial [Longimicrobium sp.]
MNTDTLISVVAPLHNDADIVAGFVDEVLGVLSSAFTHYELVLVDDGSLDATPDVVNEVLERHEFVRCIQLSRHFGEDAAISAGLESVIGDFAVVMLPNSDPPSLIPDLLERARGGVDVVYGVRTSRGDERLWARWGAAFFYWYSQRVMKLGLPKNSTHFRCLSRRALNALLRIRDRSRYLRLFTSYIGYRSEPFPYAPANRRGRHAGRGSMESLELALTLVIDNSPHPLRLVSGVALVAGLMNVVYALYVVLIYAFKSDVAEGWVTLSLQNAL